MTDNGIDYDLRACLTYNPQDGFTVEDIAQVLAVWEGENDGDDWRWILRLKDGRFVFLVGGCDYTGWDCRSDATSSFYDNPLQAALEALEHGGYESTRAECYESLKQQLETGKNTTWTERMDKEMGLE